LKLEIKPKPGLVRNPGFNRKKVSIEETLSNQLLIILLL